MSILICINLTFLYNVLYISKINTLTFTNMNCWNILLHSGKPECDNYRKSEIIWGAWGIILWSIVAGYQWDIFGIIAWLTTLITAKWLSWEIDKAECNSILNGLSSFWKILSSIGITNLLLLPWANFLWTILAALWLVIVGDTIYYIWKKVASKAMNIISKNDASIWEGNTWWKEDSVSEWAEINWENNSDSAHSSNANNKVRKEIGLEWDRVRENYTSNWNTTINNHYNLIQLT